MSGAAARAAIALGAACFVVMLASATEVRAQENFKQTGSHRTYAHWLELHDHSGRVVDPTAEDAAPFSMRETCKKCHDVDAIEHGWHFAAARTNVDPSRAGEPWLWTDARTATQLPLSYRGWPGTFRPDALGLEPFRFVLEFARHLPGAAPSYTGAGTTTGRFALSGPLDVDCMVCHGRDSSWSHERWSKSIDAQNFAWASARAMGLIDVEGDVKSLPDDVDANSEGGRKRMPKTRYDRARFGPDGRVFFDVTRVPSNEACATCHSAQQVGDGATPRWLHDDDIHLRAGMRCADCHRNELGHHTVRGFEGERHASGMSVDSFTCRGCHLDTSDARGGRLGAPLAEHRGLPVVHLEKLSCTACHSGPKPGAAPMRVQTSLAHALGVPSQTRSASDLPLIVEPWLSRDSDGVIRPHRAMWPSFWGWQKDGLITPITPDAAFATVRRALRVRKDLVAELGTGDEARTKIAAGLAAFAATQTDSQPVFVSGGRAFRLAADQQTLESFAHSVADAVSWPIAHDVRPARDALGARGCTECHAADSPFMHAEAIVTGVVPDVDPPRSRALARMQLDPTLSTAWEQSFTGRDAFKWIAVAALGLVALVIALHAIGAAIAVVRRIVGSEREPSA